MREKMPKPMSKSRHGNRVGTAETELLELQTELIGPEQVERPGSQSVNRRPERGLQTCIKHHIGFQAPTSNP